MYHFDFDNFGCNLIFMLMVWCGYPSRYSYFPYDMLPDLYSRGLGSWSVV